jgi:hypothetical protein
MFITENGDPQNVDANSSRYLESRPNLVPGQNARLANPTPNLWFNTAAFSNTGMAYGDSPRNPLVGPGLGVHEVSAASGRPATRFGSRRERWSSGGPAEDCPHAWVSKVPPEVNTRHADRS